MNQETFETYLSRLFDQDLSEQEFRELEEHLSHSPEARAYYRDYASFHNILDLELEEHQATPVGSSNVVPIERIIRRQKRRTLRIAALSAAAIVLLAIVTMRLFFIEEKPPTLVFKTSPGTQFNISHSKAGDTPEGLIMQHGSRLQLSQGSVELSFASGVKSIVMAPADLTLHKDDTLFMNQGTAWFQVPKEAIGFTVKTRDLDIVDLGTEFGVRAKPNDHDEVHVLKGKVQVTAQRLRKESAILSAGSARKIDPVGRLTKITTQPSAFLTALPKSLLYMHWSFDRVTDGGFPAQGNHPAIQLGFAKPYQANASSMQTTGRFGKAVRFNAKRAEGLLTRWPGISGSHPRTVACWIKLEPNEVDPSGAGGLVAWGVNKNLYPGYHTKWKFVIDRKGRPTVVGFNGGFYADTKSIADGNWRHVACVYTTGKKQEPIIQLYLDGQLMQSVWESPANSQKSSSNTVTDSPRSNPVCFGTGVSITPVSPGSVIRGEMDEVYIFEGALDAQSIYHLATKNRHDE